MSKRDKQKFKLNTYQKGFTLIELLIVIVVIGILSGIVISVIDPVEQQNRAKDGVVLSSLNKFALNAGSYSSTYGTSPNARSFFNGLRSGNVTSYSGCTGTGTSCYFYVNSAALPATCSNSYYGYGSTQCYYRYVKSGDEFYIYAKSHGDPYKLFRYNSTVGAVQECNYNMGGCVVIN